MDAEEPQAGMESDEIASLSKASMAVCGFDGSNWLFAG
jgi:hypothetical protein